ncbi:MAG: hypothetical protein ACKOA8_18490 [Deltaproteobacteria bacterium]
MSSRVSKSEEAVLGKELCVQIAAVKNPSMMNVVGIIAVGIRQKSPMGAAILGGTRRQLMAEFFTVTPKN